MYLPVSIWKLFPVFSLTLKILMTIFRCLHLFFFFPIQIPKNIITGMKLMDMFVSQIAVLPESLFLLCFQKPINFLVLNFLIY